MQRIAVIDYGMGNLRSVSKAIEHVAGGAAEVRVTDDPATIAGADRMVFPGQGAVRDCMAEVHARGLEPVILEGLARRPFLGICMGMQMLMERSAEHADTDCLGVFEGDVRGFEPGALDAETGRVLPVPQMGWNEVHFAGAHPLFEGIANGSHFYFANSFYVAPAEASIVTARTRYGVEFASAIGRGNCLAVQFHPEKSAGAGLRLLENFLAWTPDGDALRG